MSDSQTKFLDYVAVKLRSVFAFVCVVVAKACHNFQSRLIVASIAEIERDVLQNLHQTKIGNKEI